MLKLETEEAEQEEVEEKRGLARIGKCKWPEEKLQQVYETFMGKDLGGKDLETLRAKAMAPAENPPLDIVQRILEKTDGEAPLLDEEPDYVDIMVWNWLLCKWLMILAAQPTKEVYGYWFMYAYQKPSAYVVFSPLELLDRVELSQGEAWLRGFVFLLLDFFFFKQFMI